MVFPVPEKQQKMAGLGGPGKDRIPLPSSGLLYPR